MMPHTATRLFLVLAVALVSACAAGALGGGGSGALVSSLQVETFPDSVRLSLQVTNAGSQPVTLDFPSGQSFDFLVTRGGAEVWRWSSDRMFTQALRTETLAPGETRAFDAAWQPPAGTSGEFVARGFLTARGHAAEQQARFRLP
ncbi:MAG TPA: BsuPI-related putative proteinase inhibitor [Longimicrobiaceae bacterium]|nr:BsuPI-related putative proteinase inhibitor [Longimicrobiaceae bacterium]